MSTLELRGLGARYGKKPVLHGLDVSVGDGEFFVLLGPSGAGKTTTLKCVAGLVDRADGSVVIGGRDMTGVEPYERNVAMAFESYALYPQKTVADNLASPLRSGRLGTWTEAERAARIEAVTTTLGIDHLRERLPKELSNGQRQRTALGRVLVRPADVYLLDEPLSHLDAKLRATMRAELRRLGEFSRTTTVYVTHDYQEALALGDRIGVLRDGRLVQVGTPAELWDAPHDTFVARSLGQPEMNLLPARADGGVATTAGGLAVGVDTNVSGPVELGVRPRDLTVTAGEARPEGFRVRGRVELAERLGRSVELSVRTEASGGGPGDTLIAVTDDPDVRERTAVTLSTEHSRVHVFAGSDPGAYAHRVGSARPRTDTEGEQR
ncbi:ABC transporter ATP-binding protein [Nocardiopsis sp. HNM0947]|uniref:ABC transporter ATP-binding protein n=1 Tax=Nocardiopsis coralli TaxID=2772213 RepID=A0ABR9P7Y5_9ACTN|nr:ABC transporter ATP-binding protein [Nocardiopsis coralli]MBE2999952.1 ABC transporter ATP-binding protein [Nocardiopsis coralli]